MKSSSVAIAIKVALVAGQPSMLHGPPGCGKSQTVKQVADELQIGFIDLRLSQLDPVDLRGIPSVDTKNKITSWNPPDFLPRTKEMGGSHPERGILFLDELNSAAQGTAAAAYQLVLDRRLGDYILPKGWHIIAAGNRSTDRALVNEMSTALKNRFTHIDFEVNLDDWCAWAFGNDIHESVIGFVRFSPHLLNEFEERSKTKEESARIKALKDSKAFATPRSWEFVSKIMHAKPDRSVERELIAGTVGEGVATAFMAYIKYYRDMPNLDEILLNPKKAPVPDTKQPAMMYAVSTGLAMRSTKENFARVIEYARRLPTEFQVLVAKDSVYRDRTIPTCRAFQEWASDNKHILL